MGVSRAPTERFSDRVADYVRARPGYPSGLVPLLMREAGLRAGDAVADIGAGTGILTRLLLEAGLRVTAVEPNAAMRETATRALSACARFDVLEGTAETLPLDDASRQLLVAAQAFHWFDPPLARREFARALAPGGRVALVWNLRRTEGAFAAGYERLLQTHCPEYATSGVPAQANEDVIAAFFAPQRYREFTLPNAQSLDAAGLRARLLSSSYAPATGTPGHQPMIVALDGLFASHQRDGRVAIEYDTRVFIGPLTPAP